MKSQSQPQRRKHVLGRFGWKIMAALLVTALVPLLASVVLFELVIAAEVNVLRGESDLARVPIESASRAYQALFAARKHEFHEAAERLAASPLVRNAAAAADPELARRTLLALAPGEPALTRLALFAGGPGEAAPLAVLELSDRFKGQDMRTLDQLVTLAEPPRPGARLELTFATPWAPFREHQALGDFAIARRSLGQIHDDLQRPYRNVFLLLMGGVVLLVGLLGWLLARRAVGAVGELAVATRKLAGGDLAAEVPVAGKDEIAELGRAWNEMLRELGHSRAQITYLQKIGAWQDVARRLAHEIKNPLTPIQLAVQQLSTSYAGDDPRFKRLLGDAAEIVGEEIGTLRRLVDDFSAFAKLPRVEPAPLDLAVLAEDTLRMNADFDGRASYSGDGPIRVVGDKQLLKRALVNLIDNALEAGGAKGRAAVTVLSDGRRATLTVDDDGPGVPAELRERIFDPYFTTKERGTGLGLAIVKKILLDHGGDVTVAARADGRPGSRFMLTLPLATDASQSLPAIDAARATSQA
ncbi:MAG: HAMP domain-containing protein [Deltaproteobacteria bacterium]|nr:HAMP domain-containing protein [Deltaproteobacteria bacterium]